MCKFPRQRSPQRGFSRRCFCGLLVLVLIMTAVVYPQVRNLGKSPDAIFVLGGEATREAFAAEFALQYPELPIWISSGSNPEYAQWVFSETGVDLDRLHLDYQAVDTVTNFTTLVGEFKQQRFDGVYLITSDYHMRRAQVIGEIVFGRYGIALHPVAVPSQDSPESWGKVIRDGARSLLWVFTGRTGSSVGKYLQPHRF